MSAADGSAPQVYRAADHARMPWKNGAGTTLEVARADDEMTGELLWRVSIADVSEPGGFSLFDGCGRILSIIEGDGMVLTVDGRRSRELRLFDAFAFDGGAQTSSELLGGPIRDFNLIFSAARVTARMRWVDLSSTERFVSNASTVLVFNAGEELTVGVGGAPALGLGRLDCWRWDRGRGGDGGSGGAGESDGGGDGEALPVLLASTSGAVCAVVELAVNTVG